MNELQAIDLSLPAGSLDTYLAYVNRMPMLTADEEYSYAKKLQTENDLKCAKQLVLSHLRYVVRIAKGYLGYGLPLNDLIQEGNIGLMKAVKRFDPDMKVRLATFAIHWIKAEIQEFILRNWRIVKVATTKAQRKLFFNLRSMKKHFNWLSANETQAMAESLNVKPKTVQEMEARLSSQDPSFDSRDDEEDEYVAPANYLEDHRFNPARLLENSNWSEQSNSLLYHALEQLDDRSQDILQARWLNEDSKQTLHELANKYNVSAERIRQLEKLAMQKLKDALEGLAA